MTKAFLRGVASALFLAAGLSLAATGAHAQAKHYKFAYDQPNTTGYGIVGNVFSDKLKELSKGTMLIDQYPGAQLGQEPQVLQLVKSGDIEFCIIAHPPTPPRCRRRPASCRCTSCSGRKTIW